MIHIKDLTIHFKYEISNLSILFISKEKIFKKISL